MFIEASWLVADALHDELKTFSFVFKSLFPAPGLGRSRGPRPGYGYHEYIQTSDGNAILNGSSRTRYKG